MTPEDNYFPDPDSAYEERFELDDLDQFMEDYDDEYLNCIGCKGSYHESELDEDGYCETCQGFNDEDQE